jgi:hypothetical protein
MDTSKLVVGQVVNVVSGAYGRSGKIIRVGTDGVDLDMGYQSNFQIWKFDNKGKACDSRSVGYVPEPHEADGAPCTWEGGYWMLWGEEDWQEQERKDQERRERLSELLKAQKRFSKSLGSSIGLVRLDI